jgi:hypothetical protein
MDLPTEIWQEIITLSVQGHGLTRGLRLRLVCSELGKPSEQVPSCPKLTVFRSERFSDLTKQAIFQLRLLDEDVSFFYVVRRGWRIVGAGSRRLGDGVWHEYFVKMVLIERESIHVPNLYARISVVAEHICREIGPTADLLTTIQRLCWLSFESLVNRPGCNRLRRRTEPDTDDQKKNLLCAAIHFNMGDFVEQLWTEDHSMTLTYATSDSTLFPSPLQIALLDGNIAMLERIKSCVRRFKLNDITTPRQADAVVLSLVISAAVGGDIRAMDVLVEYVLNEIAKGVHGDIEFVNEIQASSSSGNPTWLFHLLEVAERANSPEMFDHLCRIFSCQPKAWKTELLCPVLLSNIRRGNLAMIQHLIDLGVSVEGREHGTLLLVEACKNWHEEIFEILLNNGADPNLKPTTFDDDLRSWSRYKPPLILLAASVGNLATVRKLLDRGADVNKLCGSNPCRPAIWYALRLEHTPMVRFFLERGAKLKGDWPSGVDVVAKSVLHMTMSLGLESMTELLAEYGIRAGNGSGDLVIDECDGICKEHKIPCSLDD